MLSDTRGSRSRCCFLVIVACLSSLALIEHVHRRWVRVPERIIPMTALRGVPTLPCPGSTLRAPLKVAIVALVKVLALRAQFCSFDASSGTR
jgi:hypothetical protein